jgi:hypothetical protein
MNCVLRTGAAAYCGISRQMTLNVARGEIRSLATRVDDNEVRVWHYHNLGKKSIFYTSSKLISPFFCAWLSFHFLNAQDAVYDTMAYSLAFSDNSAFPSLVRAPSPLMQHQLCMSENQLRFSQSPTRSPCPKRAQRHENI